MTTEKLMLTAAVSLRLVVERSFDLSLTAIVKYLLKRTSSRFLFS